MAMDLSHYGYGRDDGYDDDDDDDATKPTSNTKISSSDDGCPSFRVAPMARGTQVSSDGDNKLR